MISGFISRGVGVVGTPIFTRLLTPLEYGLYPLYTTWLSLTSSLITSALAGAAVYRGLQRYADRREEFISAAIGFGLMLSGSLLLFILFFGKTLSYAIGLEYGVLIMLGTECALSTVIAIKSAELRFEYKYRSLAAVNILSAILTPLLSVLFVLLTPYKSAARIFGSLSVAVIIAMPMLLGSIARGKRMYNRELWRYLLRIGLPLIPQYACSALILRVSEMVIGRSHGRAALAGYSVGVSVGLALSFLTNALIQAISPWIMRKLDRGEGEKISAVVTASVKALMLASLPVMALAPEILSIITTPEYREALPTVYPLALAAPLMLPSGLSRSADSFYERGARSALPTLTAASVSVLAALSILPHVDYRLSPLFTLAAYGILAILSVLSFKKSSGNPLVNAPKCTLTFAFCLFYGALLFALRDVLILRVILIVPLIPSAIGLAREVLAIIREK